MTSADPAFLAFLQQQRTDYGRALPERLAEIESHWRAALNDPAPHEKLASLERCAHSLAGSGATFGFAGLGDAARLLEQLVHPLVGAAAPLTPDAEREVGLAIDALQRSLPGPA